MSLQMYRSTVPLFFKFEINIIEALFTYSKNIPIFLSEQFDEYDKDVYQCNHVSIKIQNISITQVFLSQRAAS